MLLPSLAARTTKLDNRTRRLQAIESLLLFCGVVAIIVAHGVRNFREWLSGDVGLASLLILAFLTGSLALRYRWSRQRTTFRRDHWFLAGLYGLWLLGGMAILGVRPGEIGTTSQPGPAGELLFAWSELLLLLRGAVGLLRAIRSIIAHGTNPALIFVGSFSGLILVGTLLLMLPISTPAGQPSTTPLEALFTATSAGCVTGLVVVDTATHWSRFGQVVILCLIQLGGLGIMTFSAFFVLGSRRGFHMRESAILGNILEAEHLNSVRRLIWAVLGFTALSELTGAVLMSGLWSDLPWQEQLFYSLFHAISSFCNAGFSMRVNNLDGLGTHWEVWGVVSSLIIIGGLGFAVLYNVAEVSLSRLKRTWKHRGSFRKPVPVKRMSLTAKLALVTTFVLLAAGTLGVYVLESRGQMAELPWTEKLAKAWFQSVSFRTAGYNTMDIGAFQAGTKLFAVILMFIGASPGSTGGGIKTVNAALSVAGTWSLMRGRERIEIWNRTVPDSLAKRGAAIIALGALLVFTGTFLIVVIEHRPELFIDHLFEATSAFGTVGLSTGITSSLQPASQLTLAAMMFIGRVGPLTVLLALAGGSSTAKVEYPSERVLLG